MATGSPVTRASANTTALITRIARIDCITRKNMKRCMGDLRSQWRCVLANVLAKRKGGRPPFRARGLPSHHLGVLVTLHATEVAVVDRVLCDDVGVDAEFGEQES